MKRIELDWKDAEKFCEDIKRPHSCILRINFATKVAVLLLEDEEAVEYYLKTIK